MASFGHYRTRLVGDMSGRRRLGSGCEVFTQEFLYEYLAARSQSTPAGHGSLTGPSRRPRAASNGTLSVPQWSSTMSSSRPSTSWASPTVRTPTPPWPCRWRPHRAAEHQANHEGDDDGDDKRRHSCRPAAVTPPVIAIIVRVAVCATPTQGRAIGFTCGLPGGTRWPDIKMLCPVKRQWDTCRGMYLISSTHVCNHDLARMHTCWDGTLAVAQAARRASQFHMESANGTLAVRSRLKPAR